MPAPEGHCWLCNKYGKLSKEHIPPEAAFNDCPLFLMEIDRRCEELTWNQGEQFQHGVYFRSLCERCNNQSGRLYGGAYVDLARRVAERIGNVREFHSISLLGLRRPLPILKQVMLQFVTANGPGFASANDWIGPFIKSRTNTAIPKDIAIYMFASNMRSSRKSGVSAHIDLTTGKQNIVAEFTFWPLGTVISWGDLSDNRLTPIHHWAQYPFEYAGTVDLHLSVNPIASGYPIDFRNRSQMTRDSVNPNIEIKKPDEGATRDMMEKAAQRSGDTDPSGWIFTGHPTTVKKITE
ncbi:MAG: hypothetical protein JWO13_2740 [Acidobacteriales bacterium]|nr:hypothetical protein [Terriglobales bacterium]